MIISRLSHRQTTKIIALLILTAILAFRSRTVCAQMRKPKPHLLFSLAVEKTILEKQVGGSISYQTKALWKFGGFYQSSLGSNEEGSTGNSFMGVLVAAPLVKSGKINFYGNVRAGIANKIFLVVTPGISTELKLTSKLSLDVGISLRQGYLSGLSSLNFKL